MQIKLCSIIRANTRQKKKKSLERQRYALERSGIQVSTRKTEYISVNERETDVSR